MDTATLTAHKNDIVVQKFGGTSLGTTERIKRAASRISQTIKNGEIPVVVASAMGGVTDRFVRLAELVNADQYCNEYDVIISVGEQVSAGLIAAALADIGVKARSFLAWQLPIKVQSSSCGEPMPQTLHVDSKFIDECIASGIVPVVAGFQGITTSNRLITLGRGGSDLTAVAIAAALSAKRCDIFTDVDGVYTADPRLAPKSHRIASLSYDLMLEMAAHGTKVLQGYSVECAVKHGVLVNVASSFNNKPGTIVSGNVAEKTQSAIGITTMPYKGSQSKISIIGYNIFCNAGISVAIEESMKPVGIDYTSVDGSKNRLSFLVDEQYTEVALNKIHCACGLDVGLDG
ncbi:MAG: aspartate kinase [Holosporales bacterium]|nr:aspartate kinase [Holosporales bacterium]